MCDIKACAILPPFQYIAVRISSRTFLVHRTKMPSEKCIYHPNVGLFKNAYVNSTEEYRELYQRSIDDPEAFWGEIAKEFYWETTPDDVDRFFAYNFDVTKGPIFTKWFDGATTNVSYNLLDRNVRNGNGDKIAFYW